MATSTRASHEEPRIGVMTPMFNRGDKSCEYVWQKFNRQTYRNKMLFICRNSNERDRTDNADSYRCMRDYWRHRQTAHPHLVKFWEQHDYQSLGHKRNHMLAEMCRPEHGLEFICTMDDDDAYSEDYLDRMHGYFVTDPVLQLVKFRDSLCIQLLGTPVDLRNPAREQLGALLQALEGTRAYIQALPNDPPAETCQRPNSWHVHSRGGVLPTGFGYSFMFRAQPIREEWPTIQYGEDANSRSGEEDELYKRVRDRFGANAIKDLPLSESFRLACHIENGANISGDMEVIHFPTLHYVDVPRPANLVPTKILGLLGKYYPDGSFRTWATTVNEVIRRYPKHPTICDVPNREHTRMCSLAWAREDNWKFPWKCKSPYFVRPVGQPIPAGQDLPI